MKEEPNKEWKDSVRDRKTDTPEGHHADFALHQTSSLYLSNPH